MKSPEQEFNAQIKEKLSAMPFPKEFISNNFLSAAKNALRNETAPALGCDFPTLKQLFKIAQDGNPEQEITYYEMGFLINSIQSKNSFQLILGSVDYVHLLEDVAEMEQVWNKAVNPLREGLIRKLSTQSRVSKSVPLQKKIVAES